jgi:energy-coupling factor transporter ATP-binding protein EcfA2
MFHGCALADVDNGDTIVLFGPSGMGKTTLARTLGVDLAYLTDEAAGVDSVGQVVQYPKPLSILRTPDSRLKEQVSPGELGLLRHTEGPLTLRALVQLRRDSEHPGDPWVEPLHTVDALAEMVVQTSFSRRMEHPLQQLAALTRLVGGVRRVTYSEADQLRPVVASLLERRR